MERSGILLAAVTALSLCGCAHRPAASDDDPKIVRENAANNLAYAKDQAALWLTAAKDRCATSPDRAACEHDAQASYDEQLDAVQRRYETICHEADAHLQARAHADTMSLHD